MNRLIPRIILGVLCPVLSLFFSTTVKACVKDFQVLGQTAIDIDPADLDNGYSYSSYDYDDLTVFVFSYSIEVKNKHVRWIDFSLEDGLLEYDRLSVQGKGIYSSTIKIAIPKEEAVNFEAIGITTNGSSCGNANLTLDPLGFILPAELIAFSGREQVDGNLIFWSTATEENTSHFVLETSVDGEEWRIVDQIEAAGSTSQQQSYQHLDKQAKQVNYYRLRTVDFDDSEQISKVIVVERKEALLQVSLEAFPVPAINQLVTVYYRSKQEAKVTIQLTDYAGKMIRQFTQQMNKGLNTFTMDIENETTGYYLLTIFAPDTKETTRLIKG